MNDTVRVLVKKDQLILEGIRQLDVAIEKEERKLDTICDSFGTLMITQRIICCNAGRKVDYRVPLTSTFLQNGKAQAGARLTA